MAIVLDWQKKLGYSKDPFTSQLQWPIKENTFGLIAIQERLNLFLIKEERFGTISAESGMGKSTILAWMDEALMREKSHYQQLIDGTSLDRTQLASVLLKPQLSIFESRFGSIRKAPAGEQEAELLRRLAKKEHTVLLIDNAGGISKPAIELLKDIIDKTKTQVVFADAKSRLQKLALPSQDSLKLEITPYSADSLNQIFSKRLIDAGANKNYPFSEHDINAMVKKSQGSPIKLFELAKNRAMELSLTASIAPQKMFAINIQRGKELNDEDEQDKTKLAGLKEDKKEDNKSGAKEKENSAKSAQKNIDSNPQKNSKTEPIPRDAQNSKNSDAKNASSKNDDGKDGDGKAFSSEQMADLSALATAVGMEYHEENNIAPAKVVPAPKDNSIKKATADKNATDDHKRKKAPSTKHDKIVEQLTSTLGPAKKPALKNPVVKKTLKVKKIPRTKKRAVKK